MDGSSGQTIEQKRSTFLRTPTDCYVKGSEQSTPQLLKGVWRYPRRSIGRSDIKGVMVFNFRFRQFLQLSSMLRSNDLNFKIAYSIWMTDRR